MSKISIEECVKLMKQIKNIQSKDSDMIKTLLKTPQKRFLWCVVNKY